MMGPDDHILMHIQQRGCSVGGAAKRCERSTTWLRDAIDCRKTVTFDFAVHFANCMNLKPHARRMLYIAVARRNLPEEVFKEFLPNCEYRGA